MITDSLGSNPRWQSMVVPEWLRMEDLQQPPDKRKSCSLMVECLLRKQEMDAGFESPQDNKVSSLKVCPGGGMVDARDLK